jgi:hypothetical protein
MALITISRTNRCQLALNPRRTLPWTGVRTC